MEVFNDKLCLTIAEAENIFAYHFQLYRNNPTAERILSLDDTARFIHDLTKEYFQLRDNPELAQEQICVDNIPPTRAQFAWQVLGYARRIRRNDPSL